MARHPRGFLVGGIRVFESGHQLFEAVRSEITHYVGLLDPEVSWAHRVGRQPEMAPGDLERERIFDAPTRRELAWYDSPPVPAVFSPPLRSNQFTTCTGCREGDTFWATMPYAGSSDPAQYGIAVPDSDFHLYKEGQEIPATPDPYIGALPTYKLSPEPARYRLTDRFAGAETAWEFTSQDVPRDETPELYVCFGAAFERALGLPASDIPCRAEPLIFLRYNLGLDLDNRVSGTGSHAFEVAAYRQPSAAPMPDIDGLESWVSHDDGSEWQKARTRSLGDGRFEVRVVYPPAHRRASDTVSIKVEVWDVDGNRVEQTITDAFQLRDAASGGKPAQGGGPLE